MATTFWLVAMLSAAPCGAADHQLARDRLSAQCNPDSGMTRLQLDGKAILEGATTAVQGSFFSLTRAAPIQDWNWPKNRDTCHFAPTIGQKTAALPGSPTRAVVLQAERDQYVVRHEYDDAGVALTYSHQLRGQDVILRVTVENDSQDYFQLHDWMELMFDLGGAVEIGRKMDSFYPSANVYSPVVTAWGPRGAVGLNWIEHRCRPVEIRFDATSRAAEGRYRSRLWLKNSPVEPGGRTRYTLVLRADTTPGNWRHLLEPYKQWFNAWFGPVTYSVDFRVKVATFCANVELVKPDNPWGMRHHMAEAGWIELLQQRLVRLHRMNISHVLLWGVTGASRRGANYRPEFNVMPTLLREQMPLLQEFARRSGMDFGFFARPNAIAYKRTLSEDDTVEWNPLDTAHLRMADERFDDLIKLGASAFYLDTYGSSVGCYPLSAEASVMYLKRLRARAGRDTLIVSEHGFDAMHVHAMIWPSGEDDLGKRPLGDWARWLTLGTAELCRVKGADGARRVWEQGGVPIVNDTDMGDEIGQLQRQVVDEAGRSRLRPDCR